MSTHVQTCPETIDPEHRATFREDGFLAFENVLSDDEVTEIAYTLSRTWAQFHQAALNKTQKYIPARDGGTGNYDGAKIISTHPRCSLLYEAGYDPLQMTAQQAELHIRNFYHFENEDPLFTALVDHPRLRGFAEQLLGEDSRLFQTMSLSKPALIGAEKPWHQDNAYFKYAPLDAVCGVWIAIDPATVENGCMHVLPGWHGRGGLRHEHVNDCQIREDRLVESKPVPIELPPGGVLFFSGMLPHQTPVNRSDKCRRALQFHYRTVSSAEVSEDEYDRLFAEPDGTPASCRAASV